MQFYHAIHNIFSMITHAAAHHALMSNDYEF